MTEILDSETQKKIFDIVEKQPGIYISKIAETLNIPVHEVEQQLFDMQQKKIISCLEFDNIKRYFIQEAQITIREKRTNETRQQVYEIIEKNPGIYMSKIAEILNVRVSLVEYHVQQMEKTKEINGVRDRGYHRRYYTQKSSISFEERQILSILQQETLLKIILFLLQHQNAKHKDILKNFDITPSTMSYYLNKLVDSGILEIPSYTKDRGYTIKNKDQIIEILKRFKFLTLTNTFKSMWDDFLYKQ